MVLVLPKQILKSKIQKDPTVSKGFNCISKQSSRFVGRPKYTVPKKVIFTMSGIQSKITRHAKKQESETPMKRKVHRNGLRTDIDARMSRQGH